MFNRVQGFISKNDPCLKIIAIFNLVTIVLAIIFFPWVPLIANYAPGILEEGFLQKWSGLSYGQQYGLILLLTLVAGSLYLYRALRDIRQWEVVLGQDNLERRHTLLYQIRKKCMDLPYQIYLLQIATPIIAINIFLALSLLMTNGPFIIILKVTLIFFSFLTIAASILFIFSKRILARILVATYANQYPEGKRLGFIHKNFMQIIPMFIVAIIFTSIIGYSCLIEEKGNLVFHDLKLQLAHEFQKDQFDNLKNGWEILRNIDIPVPRKCFFVINPQGEIITSNQKPLSRFFIDYLYVLAPKYHGRIYDVTAEVQGVMTRIKSEQGDWIVGIQYEISSKETIGLFLISMLILLALNISVLYFSSQTLTNKLSLINKGLLEIATGRSVEPDRKLPVTSNDELSDLVMVFNQIQELEKKHTRDKLDSLGILAGGIAHDFNNILEVIIANIQVAQIKLDQGGDIRKYLKDSLDTALKAGELAKQLLTFSKGGAPIKKPVLLGELVQRVVSFALRGSDVKADFKISEDLWPLAADAGQLTQVLNNLIMNAKQAMPAGGRININVKNAEIGPGSDHPSGKYIQIKIQDHGCGIPPENLPKIFQPFFTTRKEGTGLGLTISESIITKHQGFLKVESEQGQGTSFYLYLPVRIDENGSPAILESPKDTVLKESCYYILLMDNEEQILQAVSQMLILHGSEVVTVKNGEEAVREYQQALMTGDPFDVVILDLSVSQGMGGQETIAHLLAIDPDVKAIISSGYANDPVMAEFPEFGFKGMIVKPYKFDTLVEVIDKVLM